MTATNSAAPTSTTSAAATYVVASSLAVTVTTDSASYSLNQWVTITASVLLGQSPAPGASVTFAVTEPDGSAVTKTATTDTSGVAVAKLRVKRNDPTGTYGVQAHASLDGAIFGDATSSFDVVP